MAQSRPMAFPEDRRAPVDLGWHLDKKVPITLILSLFALGGTGINAYYKHERDIDLMKARFEALEKADSSQLEQFHEGMAQVREQYKELNAKLDRLIERSGQRRSTYDNTHQ